MNRTPARHDAETMPLSLILGFSLAWIAVLIVFTLVTL